MIYIQTTIRHLVMKFMFFLALGDSFKLKAHSET